MWAHLPLIRYFRKCGGVSPKRIKSMGAEGCTSKMWGDTWAPRTLLLPLLPICLNKIVFTINLIFKRKEFAVQFCLRICIWFAFFKKGGKVSPKRIKAMGAEGWKGKMWGDTWGPSTLLLPLLPICLDTMSCKNEKRLRFKSFWAQITFDLFFFQK